MSDASPPRESPEAGAPSRGDADEVEAGVEAGAEAEAVTGAVTEAVNEAGVGLDDEARRRLGMRVLLILAVGIGVLMVVFGSTTARNYDRFEAYRHASLQDPANPPRWQSEALDVDGCVDAVLDWVETCPGVSSWCESSLPDVTNTCLDTVEIGPYCEVAGDQVLSTRFGYAECAARYDAIEGRYARRAAKKHCSLIYRVIAGRCQGGGGRF